MSISVKQYPDLALLCFFIAGIFVLAWPFSGMLYSGVLEAKDAIAPQFLFQDGWDFGDAVSLRVEVLGGAGCP